MLYEVSGDILLGAAPVYLYSDDRPGVKAVEAT